MLLNQSQQSTATSHAHHALKDSVKAAVRRVHLPHHRRTALCGPEGLEQPLQGQPLVLILARARDLLDVVVEQNSSDGHTDGSPTEDQDAGLRGDGRAPEGVHSDCQRLCQGGGVHVQAVRDAKAVASWDDAA